MTQLATKRLDITLTIDEWGVLDKLTDIEVNLKKFMGELPNHKVSQEAIISKALSMLAQNTRKHMV